MISIDKKLTAAADADEVTPEMRTELEEMNEECARRECQEQYDKLVQEGKIE